MGWGHGIELWEYGTEAVAVIDVVSLPVSFQRWVARAVPRCRRSSGSEYVRVVEKLERGNGYGEVNKKRGKQAAIASLAHHSHFRVIHQ